MILKLAPHALQQYDPSNMTLLASYNYKDISAVFDVDDFPSGFAVQGRAVRGGSREKQAK